MKNSKTFGPTIYTSYAADGTVRMAAYLMECAPSMYRGDRPGKRARVFKDRVIWQRGHRLWAATCRCPSGYYLFMPYHHLSDDLKATSLGMAVRWVVYDEAIPEDE